MSGLQHGREEGVELEAGDGNPEPGPVRADEGVVPFHESSHRRSQDAVAGILVAPPWGEEGLKPHHTFTIHFHVLTPGIMDGPVAVEELGRMVSHVLHADVVGEHEPLTFRVGSGDGICGTHRNPDALGFVGSRHGHLRRG